MTIETTDVTTGEVAGRGFFDELMRTSKDHLQQEYEAGRITGSDYANVYLGTMSANLQYASNFILQYELNNAQLLLSTEQIDNAKKEGQVLDGQIAQLTAQNLLLDHELITLRPKQAQQLDNQNSLLLEQIGQQAAQTALVAQQTLGQTAQNAVIGKQEDLLDKQILTETANTTDATGGLAKATLDKTTAEVSILNQKELTEAAQTVGTTSTIGGLVGAEMALKEEQRASFLRDAEQKAAKFYADMLSIAYSTAPEDAYNDPAAWGFGQVESNRVTAKLLTGINA